MAGPDRRFIGEPDNETLQRMRAEIQQRREQISAR
jgi:hypothetical protein